MFLNPCGNILDAVMGFTNRWTLYHVCSWTSEPFQDVSFTPNKIKSVLFMWPEFCLEFQVEPKGPVRIFFLPVSNSIWTVATKKDQNPNRTKCFKPELVHKERRHLLENLTNHKTNHKNHQVIKNIWIGLFKLLIGATVNKKASMGFKANRWTAKSL